MDKNNNILKINSSNLNKPFWSPTFSFNSSSRPRYGQIFVFVQFEVARLYSVYPDETLIDHEIVNLVSFRVVFFAKSWFLCILKPSITKELVKIVSRPHFCVPRAILAFLRGFGPPWLIWPLGPQYLNIE